MLVSRFLLVIHLNGDGNTQLLQHIVYATALHLGEQIPDYNNGGNNKLRRLLPVGEGETA